MKHLFLLLILLLFSQAQASSEENSYEDIVNQLKGQSQQVQSSGSLPIGGYFSITTANFANSMNDFSGNRYTPEFGLYIPGRLRVFGRVSLLSGSVGRSATQEFGNFGFGFDYRLLNLARSPQMDLWLNTEVRLASAPSESSLATPADSYIVGATVVNSKSSVRSQMSANHEFRTNEQVVGLDFGDRSHFHFDLSFETFDGVFIGAEANWFVVQPLRIDGSGLTPTVSWMSVGPRVEVSLFQGLDLNLLLLYPMQRSHDVGVLEAAAADAFAPRINEPTFSFNIEAGI